MLDHPDNPPAFPGGTLPEHRHVPNGMTIRDWFAGQALSEAIQDYDRKTRAVMGEKVNVLPWATKSTGTREQIIARHAYRYADAMLEARKNA